MLVLDARTTVRRSRQAKGGKKASLMLQRLINTLHTHLDALFELGDRIFSLKE